jgi:hypothetical protein
MKLKIALLSVAFFPLLSLAQVAMGGWSSHFAYNQTDEVEQSASKIFAVADGALFSVGKEDNSLETYSKIDGLNDFSISKIKYNETLGALLIAYEDGNIDLLSSDGVSNIPDIKDKNVTASKIVNDILFVNEYAYVSNGIGIVVVNLKKKEITDTYIVGNNSTMVPIKSVAMLGDSIYAVAATGMYVASASNKFLADYGNWKYRSNIPLPSTGNTQLVVFNNKIYLLKSSGAVYSSSDAVNWTLFDNSQTYLGIKVSDSNLLLNAAKSVVKYNQSLVQESFSDTTTNDVIYNSSQSAYWIAADSAGLVKVVNGAITETFRPEGPATNKIFTLQFQGTRLFALSGGPWDIDDYSRPGAVMIYENSSWKNIIRKDVYPYTQKNFFTLAKIGIDKSDQTHFFVSTYHDGLYEFKNDLFAKLYDNTNSLLTNVSSKGVDYALHAVGYDNNNYLWMAQDLATNSILALKTDGTWISNNYSKLTSHNYGFDDILVSGNNFKWFNAARSSQNGGLFVLNDNNDPSDVDNHVSTFFSSVTDQDGNVISINPVYCMARDSDDDVWIGGANGPIVFQNIANVFNSGYTVQRPKIPRNDGTDYADYLLTGQKIRAIVVDPANRKWIGTSGSGAYLMSSDGLTTIQHFTAENSPLLSDNVLCIAINSSTGEVFFGTDLGLVSYKSDASSGGADYSNISVYPNPVRESYTGTITINGLMSNSTVKITDTNGNLIYQTKSNGGTATWNGQNTAGKRVNTGVYFIMGSNASESNTSDVKTAIGKILIIK